MNNNHGFTLVEALVVLFLMAITAAFAVPGMLSWLDKARLNGAVNNIKGNLELAKLQAIDENGAVAVHFYGRRYEVFRDNGATIGQHDAGEKFLLKNPLPAGIRIDLAATTFPGSVAGCKKTRFRGRGTCGAGTVCLVNSRGQVKKVIVSSTGRIRTE